MCSPRGFCSGKGPPQGTGALVAICSRRRDGEHWRHNTKKGTLQSLHTDLSCHAFPWAPASGKEPRPTYFGGVLGKGPAECVGLGPLLVEAEASKVAHVVKTHYHLVAIHGPEALRPAANPLLEAVVDLQAGAEMTVVPRGGSPTPLAWEERGCCCCGVLFETVQGGLCSHGKPVAKADNL